jgi:uncharacterized membrane protein
MWTRAELKANAKSVLRNSYWEGVIANLIVFGISAAIGLLAMAVPFGSIVGTIFVMLPLTVGLNYFYMQNQIAPPVISTIFFPFSGGRYMRITGAMAWMYLFTILWQMISMIGIIILLAKGFAAMLPFLMDNSFLTNLPSAADSLIFDNSWLTEYFRTIDSSWFPALAASGIIFIVGSIIVTIKTLSYSMTPFILTDNPAIGHERALKLSIAMTNGQKWRIFVLYLSFIGWAFLAVLALGIGLLFLAPYLQATQAQLYVKLRDNALDCGLTTPEELNVVPKQ